MAKCPNGHESDWNDYCSACGAPMAGAAAPSPPDPGATAKYATETCPSCGAPRDAGVPFCESCGHDFASPTPSPAATAATAASLDNVAVVRADRTYYDAHSAGSGLDFPDPLPAPLVIPLAGDEITIGRHSQSRGLYPPIDLSGDNEDAAVSHKHAVLRRTEAGWTVTDLGSTNGTRVDLAEDPITPGTPVPLPAGASIYVGAWSRITLESR
jgi:ribosomal protein L37AE/L43A